MALKDWREWWQRHGGSRLAMEHWRLRERMLFLALAPALLMLVLLLGYFLQARMSDVDRELSGNGQLMARQLAASADYAVISGNTDSLRGQLDALLRQPGVVRVRLYDAGGVLLLEQVARRFQPGQPVRDFTAAIEPLGQGSTGDDWLAPPAHGVPQLLGRVEISISNELVLAREREILFTGLILGCLALVVTFLLASFVAQRFRRPLEAVVDMVGRLQAREFSARVDVGTGGEIGALGEHLNALARTLEDARQMQTRYTQDLVTARAQADRASRAKSEFLAMMSHELRTPLNGVSGMLQLLEATRLSDEQRDYVRHAGQAGSDLLRMVDDILDFSRLEQGKLSFELKPFTPASVVNAVVDEFRPEARRRQLGIELEIGELPPGRQLLGDALRLRQVLVKLIDNAIKFTPSGRITVRVQLLERPGQQLLFNCEVCDTGIGIESSHLAQIFEPFVQGESSASRRYGGTGLGLAIARRLVELMQGSLSVDSEPGVGSCFVFEVLLPWQDSAPEPASQSTRARARVLVVEDNPANQLVAEGMLRQMGCAVTVADDGEAALALLDEQPQGFDLVFMDCQLPGIDGFETTRRWRRLEQELASARRLPVVALTAHAQDAVAVACREAGMDAVLTKPFRRHELAAVLAQWLEPGTPIHWSSLHDG
ncbi:MAG: ATP-binding protein [Moraxellaceae bacterium]